MAQTEHGELKAQILDFLKKEISSRSGKVKTIYIFNEIESSLAGYNTPRAIAVSDISRRLRNTLLELLLVNSEEYQDIIHAPQMREVDALDNLPDFLKKVKEVIGKTDIPLLESIKAMENEYRLSFGCPKEADEPQLY